MAATWELSWEPPEGVIVDHYNLYFRLPGDTAYIREGSTTATRFTLTIPEAGLVEWAVAAVVGQIEADPEDWVSASFDPADRSDMPALSSITDFAVSQDGPHVVAKWSAVDDPNLENYEIRLGATWENGIIIDRPPASVTSARLGWWATGSQTWWINAKATHGAYATTADSVTLTIQPEEYMPVQGTHDEDAGGYGGTKSSTEVVSTDLRLAAYASTAGGWTSVADTYTGLVWGPYIESGTYTTDAQDVGSVVDEKIEVGLTAGFNKVTDTADAWYATVRHIVDSSGNRREIDANSTHDFVAGDGTILGGLPLTVEIDTAQDGVPTWDGWRVWVPGTVYRYRQVRLRITFSPTWLFGTPSLSAFTWKRRRQNRKDEGSIALSATGGTDISFVTNFTVAPKMEVSAEATTALIVTFNTVTTSGAKVYVFDEGGTEQSSGTVHWQATGV